MSGSYKQTVVWQWLQAVPSTPGALGEMLRVMKGRVDMPQQFPNKSYLYRYLTQRCKIDHALADQSLDSVWSNYKGYRDLAIHNYSERPVRWDKSIGGYVI